MDPLLTDARLRQLYQRNPGAVAYVDESYRAAGAEPAFYEMSAVTIDKNTIDTVRTVLTDIAGSRYWHTTEAVREGRSDAVIEMNEYLAQAAEWSLVTVEATVNATGGMNEARQTCLAALVREVTRGSGPGAARLIVADRNQNEETNHADRRTLAALRTSNDIERHVMLHHTSMGREPVLWSADVVAWSARRAIALDDDKWIAPMRDVMTVLDARTGTALNMKQSQAAAATPGTQPTVGALRRGESAVASEPTIRRSTGPRPGQKPAGRTLSDLAAQAREVRQKSGARGLLKGNLPKYVNDRAKAMREHAAAHDEAAHRLTEQQRATGPERGTGPVV